MLGSCGSRDDARHEPAGSHAQPIRECSDGRVCTTQELVAVADTTMWSADAPSATWGSAAYLVVSYEPWYSAPQRDVSMVRFDQAALAAAVGSHELVRATRGLVDAA